MKNSVLALSITGVLAVGAGVAIAGLPSDPPGGDLVIRSAPAAATTTTVALPATVAPSTTESDTDDDANGAVTTEPEPTSPPATGDAEVDSTDTTDTGSDDGDDTDDDTTDGDIDDGAIDDGADGGENAVDAIVTEIPRAELVVATANAGGTAGLAGATAAQLESFGYDAQPVDAERLSDTTTVYFAEGFNAEAARLAADLGLTSGDIAPMSTMPRLLTERIFQLVALIGTDRV
jgi:hypothetical protein